MDIFSALWEWCDSHSSIVGLFDLEVIVIGGPLA